MPSFLKLITASGFIFPLFFVGTIWPNSTIKVFGHQVAGEVWWASGGGALSIVVALLLCTSSVLMLRSFSRGRFIYLCGWVLMTITIPVVAIRLDIISNKAISATVSNLFLTVLLGMYLYRNREVQKYFGANGIKG